MSAVTQSCAVTDSTAGQRLCVRSRAADSTSESSNMGHLESDEARCASGEERVCWNRHRRARLGSAKEVARVAHNRG